MAESWDLNAVVRSCAAISSTSSSATSSTNINISFENPLDCMASLTFEEAVECPFGFPKLVVPRKSALEELQGICQPFISASAASNSPMGRRQQQRFTTAVITSSPFPSESSYSSLNKQQLRQEPLSLRKKKANMKRTVCQVSAENLSADLWAWRKYGKKPIKGSPHPRNYYKCSSCKGCAARKQVERSKTDPNIFNVTYTGEHKHPRPAHRNSLAGSTRNKSAVILTPPCSSPLSASSISPAVSLSPATPLIVPEEEDVATQKSDNGEYCRVTDGVGEDANEMLIQNPSYMAMTEDVFMGPRQLWCRDGGRAAAVDIAVADFRKAGISFPFGIG